MAHNTSLFIYLLGTVLLQYTNEENKNGTVDKNISERGFSNTKLQETQNK